MYRMMYGKPNDYGFCLKQIPRRRINDTHEVMKWCEEHFGPSKDSTWKMVAVYVFIRDDHKAFEFRMRWC